ncbi:MAG: type II toxin-antitoxin system HigB family toxin [Nitratireductor sp.]|nr:type II toxin-antitoxin system HigB family toxin [Nitratireductor sp.]
MGDLVRAGLSARSDFHLFPIREQFGKAVDFVGDNRVIFDIGGNKFRLIVHVAYPYKRVLIKFVGTHAEYDKIDAEKV